MTHIQNISPKNTLKIGKSPKNIHLFSKLNANIDAMIELLVILL